MELTPSPDSTHTLRSVDSSLSLSMDMDESVDESPVTPASVPEKDVKTKLTNMVKRQHTVLTKLCPNSSDCVALGKFGHLIRDYFENFDTKYAISTRRIGEPSAMGFVNEITYERNGYKTYSVLKSAAENDSDNLLFEWYIGSKFINKLVPKFPCFLETYHLCTTGLAEYNRLKIVTSSDLRGQPKPFVNIDVPRSDIPYGNSCENPTRYSVLIQHFNPNTITSFHKFIADHRHTEIGFNVHILNILLQVYIPLGRLGRHFTHNDLHTNNILIYKIPDDKYITLTYKFDDKTITMKTQFIAKIIDYGRSYFADFDDKNNSSRKFYNDLIQDPKCNLRQILDANGYSWFDNPTHSSYFISQIYSNISKDLWPLYTLGNFPGKYTNPSNPVTMSLRHTIIPDLIASPNAFMTVPDTKTCSTKPICNVIQAMNRFCDIYLNNLPYLNAKQNEAVAGKGTIGELEIFVSDLSKDSIFRAAPISGGKRKTKKQRRRQRKTRRT